MIFNALTIAGSDSSGGAGIQADLKTFAALKVYGLSVLTALTAQNTQGVTALREVSSDFLMAQLNAVFEDIRIDTVKIGMLANAKIIKTVAKALIHYQPKYVVLDTVMIAKSGHMLLEKEAVNALRDILLPIVDLITPNLPEAATLCETSVAPDEKAMRKQARLLLAMGCKAVLIKGGHLQNDNSPDWLLTPQETTCFELPRISTNHIHGTGCTLSAAIAALRPQRLNWSETIKDAKDFLQGALKASNVLTVGKGAIGPLHHFYQWW
jgi:hydroxymethylpyrimidine/phosphomethylpyrimidine kinase